MNDRKQELLKIFESVKGNEKQIVINLIDEVVFLENNLTELKKEPFIKYHPSNHNISKQTASGKMYKEMLQQYNNTIKLLLSVLKNEDGESDSPLQAFAKLLVEKGFKNE